MAVTVYSPELFTMMDDVLSPVDQTGDKAGVVAVSRIWVSVSSSAVLRATGFGLTVTGSAAHELLPPLII